MEQRADAVVIGGGPAGSVAAIALADLGWRTMLVERGDRHRAKSCGHCLNPRALPLLERIGAGSIAREAAVGRIDRLSVHLTSGQFLSVPMRSRRDGAAGLVVERRRFDQGLIDLAAARGVEVVQGASAQVLGRDSGGAKVAIGRGTEAQVVRCELVVGADGLRSRVALAAGLSRAGRGCGPKFGFSFDLAGRSNNSSDPEAIHMFVAEQGYLGLVRQGNDVLHVAALAGPGNGDGREPLAFCQRMAVRFPLLDRFGLGEVTARDLDHLHAAGPMPWRPRRIAHDWAALVGDAAGYVEPFTGEGMSWAIESAVLLGEAARFGAPGAWSASAAREYERRWRARIGAAHRTCRAIAWMLERSGWCAALVSIASRHPARVQRVIHRLVPT